MLNRSNIYPGIHPEEVIDDYFGKVTLITNIQKEKHFEQSK